MTEKTPRHSPTDGSRPEWTDSDFRIEALHLAVSASTPGGSPQEVVAKATAFHAFMTGAPAPGEDPRAPLMTFGGKPNRPAPDASPE